MPDTTNVDPEILSAFHAMEGTSATPANVPDDVLKAFHEMEAAAPPYTPDSAGEAAAFTGDTTETLKAEQRLPRVTPNISLINDLQFRVAEIGAALGAAGKEAKAAHAKLGLGSQDLITKFSSDTFFDHVAQMGIGDVSKITSNPKAKEELWNTAISRMDQFLTAKGYKGLVTAEEVEQFKAAFLMGETVYRAPLSPDSLRQSTHHALQTFVGEQRQKAQEQGAIDTKFMNAAAYLADLTPDEALQLRGFAASRSDRIPQNEQEAQLINGVGTWYGDWESLDQPGVRNERRPARAYDALRVVLGTTNPSDNILNTFERTDATWKAKDLGLIQGDITRPGVTLPDKTAPGGFSDIDLVPPDILVNLERRKHERGITTPFDVPADPTMVTQVQNSTGADFETASRVVENASAAAGAKVAQDAGMGARMDRKVGNETFTATEWNALSYRNRALVRLGEALGPAMSTAMKPFEAWREAQRGGVGEAAAQRVVYTISGDEYLAQQAHSLSDIASIGFGLMAQYSLLTDSVNAAQAQKMSEYGTYPTPMTNIIEAGNNYDQATQARLFKAGTTAAKLWANAKTREDSRAAEQAREVRMSTAERNGYTEDYSRIDYASDVWGSAWHNVLEGLGHSAAQVIDTPEAIPLLLGVNKLGDAGIAGAFGSIKRGIGGAISAQNLSASMKKILRFSAHEAGHLEQIVKDRIEKAIPGGQEALVKTLSDLESHATALREEWESTVAGGAAPTGESIDRVAHLWKKASSMGVDFEELDDMASRMAPKGAFAQLARAGKNLVGIPSYLSDIELRALSKSYQELGNRIAISLGRAPTEIVEATELEKIASQHPDVNTRMDAGAKLAELQQGHARPLGLAKQVELYSELDSMVQDVAAGRGADNRRFQEIRTQLWGDPTLTKLDHASLLQLADTKRFAPDGPVQKFLGKMFGYTPEQIRLVENEARRTLDFAVRDAQDLYLAKFGSEFQNARRGRAYRVAQSRVRYAEARLEMDYAGYPQDEIYKNHKNFLGEQKRLLEVEQRRSQMNPATAAWTLDDSKVLMQTLTDEDLTLLVDTDPVMFGGVRRADLMTKDATGKEVIDQGKIRALFDTPSLETKIGEWKSLARGEQLVELEKRIRASNGKMRAAAETEKAALQENISLDRVRAMRDIGLRDADVSSQVATHLLGAEIEGLGGSGLPFWGQGRALRELPRLAANRQAAQMLFVNDLHTELAQLQRQLPKEVYNEMAAAMRSGKIKGTVADYPALRAKFEQAFPSGDATRQTNLENFLQHAEQFRVSLIEDKFKAGQIDPHFYASLVEKGYDPHKYGIHEVSKLVKDKKVQAIAANLKGKEPGLSVGSQNEALMFERDMFRHRVRVREADGFIRDEKFGTEKQALDYVRRTYGNEAAVSFKGVGDGLREGKTASGDRIVLSDPIGNEGLEALGISMDTPALMLKSFEDTVRDTHMHMFLSSLRSTGMVIDPVEYHNLVNRFGSSAADFQAQFRRLPNDTKRLGNLAGSYVHRKVFTELNHYQHNFEQFRVWMDALTDSFMGTGASVPEELIVRTPGMVGKVFRGATRAVKQGGIIYNASTWASNILFNVTLSHLIDGRIFAAENRDSWKLAHREIWMRANDRATLYGSRHPLYRDFVEDGFSQGKPVDVDIHAPSIRNFLHAFELDNPAAVDANIAKYEKVLGEYNARLQAGEHPKNLEKVELHLAALRAVKDEYEKGLGRRAIQKLGGFFLANKNLMGLPNAELASALRTGYANIDETFKFVNYVNLRKRMSRQAARWELEQHFQDYSKVPYTIGALANNPVGSMVPAFPFELGRIGKNLFENKPLKTLALMSIIPALNTISAGLAGVDDDRVTAVLNQAGHRNMWERIKAKGTELRLWNPVTKQPFLTMNTINFLPFSQITEGRGLLNQGAEYWFPEEKRGIGQQLMAEGLGLLGNFLGNNIFTNGVGVAVFNRDSMTGQQVIDSENARPRDWLKAGWRHFGRQFMPRVATTVLEDMPRSLSAPVDPVTGRPVGVPHWTELLTNQMGMRIRGLQDMFKARAKVAGRPMGDDEALVKSAIYGVIQKRDANFLGNPQYGPETDIKWYTAALADPTLDPKTKAEYEKELKDLLHKDREIDILGKTYKMSTTERQDWMNAGRLEQRGVPTAFVQATPEEQALILTWVDRGGARSETIGELINMATRNRHGRYLLERDPDSLKNAVQILQQHAAAPGADPRLAALMQHWTVMQPSAGALFQRDRLRKEALRRAGVR